MPHRPYPCCSPADGHDDDCTDPTPLPDDPTGPDDEDDDQ